MSGEDIKLEAVGEEDADLYADGYEYALSEFTRLVRCSVQRGDLTFMQGAQLIEDLEDLGRS
jgi:hypothetical protein